MPHAALWVVQPVIPKAGVVANAEFQCRTRLCGWCSCYLKWDEHVYEVFQCRTRLCGWCSIH